VDDSGGERGRGVRVLEGVDDEDLVRLLREQGCEGLLWLAAIDDFATYSWRAFVRVLKAGSLHSRTSNRNRPISLTRTEWHLLLMNPVDVEDLFYAALGKQIALFAERTCAGEGWMPDGGMALRDYFFNGVLLQLANPVRAWRRRVARERTTVVTDPAHHGLAERPDPGWGPEEIFLATEDARTVVAALAEADPRLRRAILLRADTGSSWAHIAREVGMTTAALEGLRRRFVTSSITPRSAKGEQ
jgi:hypothetical protein